MRKVTRQELVTAIGDMVGQRGSKPVRAVFFASSEEDSRKGFVTTGRIKDVKEPMMSLARWKYRDVCRYLRMGASTDLWYSTRGLEYFGIAEYPGSVLLYALRTCFCITADDGLYLLTKEEYGDLEH